MLTSQWDFDEPTNTLACAGYVRGAGFSVKYPIHITGMGDFQVQKIVRFSDPVAAKKGLVDNEMRQDPSTCLAQELTPQLEKELLNEWEPLQPYDPLNNEQTWPTVEEEQNALRGQNRRRRLVKVPVGITEYERRWFEEEVDANDEFRACPEITVVNQGQDENDDAMSSDQDDGGTSSSSVKQDDDNDDQEWNQLDDVSTDLILGNKRIEMEERSKEDYDFPDEVDTPTDVLAKVRFQKYRGLDSLRTSVWDSYEDLPVEYSRIFEFESFSETAKAARRDLAANTTGCSSGDYCCLYLRNVSREVLGDRNFGNGQNSPLVVSTLFPFERKVTVVNFTVTRVGGASLPVKSKDEVELHCGFRRLPARPIYSQHIREGRHGAAKAKMERFLPADGQPLCVASIYGPVIFSPCPVLLFVVEGDERRLVGSGSVLAPDPLRLIIKRVVLTGYPIKVHKKKAVVRYMFYHPQDIKWFKPIMLHSKSGLRGHIKEALGTHGHMKCIMNDGVSQSDTICMYLYKRAFPKWFPPSWGENVSNMVD